MRRLSRACACRALVSALQLAGAEAPLARVRVPRAGAKMDQHQAIEIPRFRDRETGDNRAAKAVGQGCAASGEAPGQMSPLYGFMECSGQEGSSGTHPDRRAGFEWPPWCGERSFVVARSNGKVAPIASIPGAIAPADRSQMDLHPTSTHQSHVGEVKTCCLKPTGYPVACTPQVQPSWRICPGRRPLSALRPGNHGDFTSRHTN